jgi:hypothetical protein
VIPSRRDLCHDLLLPALLFAALGGMTWAVRGCSGFGAMNGCIFAGVTWGAAWWFIARDPGPQQSRPYNSGWIILAVTIGVGISGARGWMQWPSFFEGHLQTNTPRGEFVPISKSYGYLWLFIAGVPWAGLGACTLAWCNSLRATRVSDWALRLFCGIAFVVLARMLFTQFPEIFLPLYKSIRAQYDDLGSNPNLRRLINDNRSAIAHLGLYLGFLLAELIRRDWRNVTLISTVGLVNGAGWALCQNWKWAASLWPKANFNFWRCWESSGGISIGLAYGLAYYLANRPIKEKPDTSLLEKRGNTHPNLERMGAYLGLLFGLGLSLKNGLKGWANIYLGDENHWNQVFWQIIGPLMLLSLVGLIVWIRARPLPAGYRGDVFPQAYLLIWLVLLWQNIIAQLVTGPKTVWNEMAFKMYYVLLFFVSAVIIYHFHFQKTMSVAQTREKNLREPQLV